MPPRHSQKHSAPPKKSTGAAAQGLPPTEEALFFERAALWGAVGCLAVALSWIFWWPLWNGGGLVGGDLYPYYFPQKTYLADNLRAGIIPLWNSLVGFGYPVLGESQTAALYPPNLLLFSILDVNTAYNVSQLGHYLLAFVGTYCLARRWGLGPAGGLLTATVFVYGWFPSRICLEWAIVGGAWFVWILWAATAFLQTGRHKYLALTAAFLGLDLLAGHYNLAFITLLTLLPFPWLVKISFQNCEKVSRTLKVSGTLTSRIPGFEMTSKPESSSGEIAMNSERPGQRPRLSRGTWLAMAVGIGFLIAAVQLLPTWELKSLSQRNTLNESFAPTYGHLPPQAISQLWIPWVWYAGEKTMDEQLAASKFLAVPNATNQTEAQFYIGLFPLILILLGLALPQLRKDLTLQRPWGWLLLAGVSLVFATGWPTYWLTAVPGLNFFRGPGRYSITAACAFSLLAGAGLDALISWRRWGFWSSTFVTVILLGLTTTDLWTASRQYQYGISPYIGRKVFYSVMLDGPPLKFLRESALHNYFQEAGDNSRLYAPGANLPSLLGVSTLPVYLGLGPEIYESNQLQVDFATSDPAAIADAVQRLRKFGVTHLLLEKPINPALWPVTSQKSWMDRLLNVAQGKSDPYFLYILNDSPGRASIVESEVGGKPAENRIRSLTVLPNRVQVEVECSSDCKLVLRDLFYPGWKLSDDRMQEQYEDLFRVVELKAADSKAGIQTVEWVYRPASVYWGAVLSVLGLAGLVAIWFGYLPMASGRRQSPDGLGTGEVVQN